MTLRNAPFRFSRPKRRLGNLVLPTSITAALTLCLLAAIRRAMTSMGASVLVADMVIIV